MADIQRIKTLLNKLGNGGDVSMRDLKNVLGEDGVTEYESLWQSELDVRSQFEDKPDEIKRYEEMVHAADFDNNRAEGLKFGKRAAIRRLRLRNDSETKYELAIEYLEGLLSTNPELRIWFDRELDFSDESVTVSIDCDGIPRTVTSRSKFKQSSYMAEKRTKADVKRDVLTSAIDRLERGDKLGGVGKLGKLRKFGGVGEVGGAVKVGNEKAKGLKKMILGLTKKTIE